MSKLEKWERTREKHARTHGKHARTHEKGIRMAKAAATAALAAVVGVGGLGGCSDGDTPASRRIASEVMDAPPDAQQAAVARDLGFSDDEVQALMQGKASWTVHYSTAWACYMLDRLEERYGEEFRAKNFAGAQLMDRRFSLLATVETGPYKDTEVLARYCWYNQEKPFVDDNLIDIMREGEYIEYLTSIIDEVYAGTTDAVPAMDVQYIGQSWGELWDPYAPMEQFAQWARGRVHFYWPPWCDYTEEEYYGLIAKLKVELEARNMGVDIISVVVTELVEASDARFNIAWANESIHAGTEEHPTSKWKIREKTSMWRV